MAAKKSVRVSGKDYTLAPAHPSKRASKLNSTTKQSFKGISGPESGQESELLSAKMPKKTSEQAEPTKEQHEEKTALKSKLPGKKKSKRITKLENTAEVPLRPNSKPHPKTKTTQDGARRQHAPSQTPKHLSWTEAKHDEGAPKTAQAPEARPSQTSSTKRAQKDSQQVEQPQVRSAKLFVGNLPASATSDDLRAHFEGIGPLRRAFVITDRGDVNASKRVAFVYYALGQHAATAVATLDGSLLRGRRIFVSFARPREGAASGARVVGGEERKEGREGSGALSEGGDAEGKSRPEGWEAGASRKVSASMKGSLPMRTVLVSRSEVAETDGSVVSEEAVRTALSGDKAPNPQSIVTFRDSALRVTFESWSEAGAAAAEIHGVDGLSAVVEALASGSRTRLIVRNLPFRLRVADVRDAFAQVAPVRDLQFAPGTGLRRQDGKRDGDGGDNGAGEMAYCGGFAFVEYFLVSHARLAIQRLNGSKIGKRNVAVDLATNKDKYVRRIRAEGEVEAGSDGEEGKTVDGEEDETAPGDENKNREHNDGTGESDPKDEGDGNDGSDDNEDDGGDKVNIDEPQETPTGNQWNPRRSASDNELSRTVFVRNLLFETTANELRNAMGARFGTVEQALLVRDAHSGRPRGTGFVRFTAVEMAVRAVRAGGTAAKDDHDGGGDDDDEEGNSKPVVLDGRQLLISHAVARAAAARLVQKDGDGASQSDPRNLALAWVGHIAPDSRDARGLSQQDLARRAKSEAEKRHKLAKNPNTFVSDVRLCVRNLPRDMDEKTLKQMFLCAARSGLVLKGRGATGEGGKANGAPVAKETIDSVRVTHCAISRSKEPQSRSKGFGFVQFSRHKDALHALSRTNNNVSAIEELIAARPNALMINAYREKTLRRMWGRDRRLIVEFAVEDRRIVQVLERVREEGRAKRAGGDGDDGGGESGARHDDCEGDDGEGGTGGADEGRRRKRRGKKRVREATGAEAGREGERGAAGGDETEAGAAAGGDTRYGGSARKRKRERMQGDGDGEGGGDERDVAAWRALAGRKLGGLGDMALDVNLGVGMGGKSGGGRRRLKRSHDTRDAKFERLATGYVRRVVARGAEDSRGSGGGRDGQGRDVASERGLRARWFDGSA